MLEEVPGCADAEGVVLVAAVLEEDLARKEGEMVEGLPQRDIDFADSITVLRIDEVCQIN